ncbi:MAG: aminopeptidase P family protein [Acidobacteria bacterium]|nr:aminopeptidase P family protein [Acidobacteriota bacterium]
MNHRRLNGLREFLPRSRADALLVSGLANIRYLTGFTGSSALLLVSDHDAVLFTDRRYEVQAAQEVQGAAVTVARGPLLTALIGSLKRRCLRRLGFERGRASYELYEALRSRLEGCRLRPVAGTVEQLRAIKDAGEIEFIRRAVELNSAVFEKCLGRIRAGRTEADLASAIDHTMRLMGGEKPAFETIVAAGPRSALPHARPSLNLLRKNEFILVDQGVILRGYSSDMTRTMALGDPGRKGRRVYQAVLEAQMAAISQVRPGVTAEQVDRQARKVFRKHGLEKAFVHSTGHGVGLEIHEAPRLGRREKTKLEAGMVVTIEPGAYLEGFGGVRIEDMVLVTERGCEVLTPTPKDLRVL